MYALNLAEDGRILSATYSKYASSNAIMATVLPEGNIFDYLYIDNKYVYNPISVSEDEDAPSKLDVIEAQVTYTAMMTDTLLEV